MGHAWRLLVLTANVIYGRSRRRPLALVRQPEFPAIRACIHGLLQAGDLDRARALGGGIGWGVLRQGHHADREGMRANEGSWLISGIGQPEVS